MVGELTSEIGVVNMNTTKMYNVLKTGIQNVHFKNWSETFQCRPELFFIPSTEEEIKQILEFAREKRKKVRVVGCRHSPSDIACTDDVMISLKNFNRILEVDKKNLQVMVEAGVVISDLNESLYSHNLALPVLGSTSNISIGGAISVATHGSGIRYGTLSTYVTELDLMLSDGSVKKFSADRDKELFLAAVCSLGSFGIILRVSLQCEAAFNLQLRQYSLGLQDVIEHLDVHIEGSDHFRFMWFPYTDGVVVCHSQRTEKPITKVSRLQKCYDWFWSYGIGYYTLEFCYYLSTYYPFLVPYINRIFYNLMYSMPVSNVDRSYKIFNFECLFKQYVNEWAIPKSKTGVVLWTLREWMLSSPNIYVHFPIEVRFVKGDNILISPAYGQDVCYINIIMYRPYGKTVPYKEYWRAYENIMAEANGRPHWAKAHSVKAETFKQIYPYFGKWCLIREMLDPINMFYNAYMARIFSMESQTS